MILIIAQEDEPNVDAIEVIFKENAVRYVRFNTEDFPLKVFLKVDVQSQSSLGYLDVSGHKIDLSAIKTVWFRRQGQSRFAPGLKPAEENFLRWECQTTLENLLANLNCFWVNDFVRGRTANYKLVQLRAAEETGLNIPRTIITNNPDEVRIFYAECNKQVAFKVVGFSILFEDFPEGSKKASDRQWFGTIYTNLLKETNLDKLETLRQSPCIFQEYIPKKFELRITVVGRHIFAAEIHSQNAPKEGTRIDWRRYDLSNTPHHPHKLPPDVAEKLLRFMDRLGLAFGCIDMIVTPDGRYVFLEVNPDGQYGWIENVLGFPINQTLAEMLIRGRIE